MEKAIKLMGEQYTPEWYRARAGKFTASAVYALMGKGRAKDQVFSATAKKYIYETAHGRLLRPAVFEDEAEVYRYRTSAESFATRYGHEHEEDARVQYELVMNTQVTEGGMYQHPQVACLTASPDGIVGEDGLIEIKCPYGVAKFVEYAENVNDGEGLKATAPEYYYQIQTQLAVTGRAWCDFVVYDPFLSHPVHIARIQRNEEDITAVLDRVKLADEEVNKIVEHLTPDF